MKREWKVGELAKLAGLTVRTLRYYDQIGLFSPSGHTDSGHRLYTESDIAGLQHVYTYTLDQDDKRISVSVATVEIKPAESGARLIYTEHGAIFYRLR